MKIAIVNNGIIENVVVSDNDSLGINVTDVLCDIGWPVADGVPVAPPSKYHSVVNGEWTLTENAALELIEDRKKRAKITRDYGINSPITVLGVKWDCDAKALSNFNEAISGSDLLGLAADHTVEWVLADDSIRNTTIGEMKQVLSSRATRKMEIWARYTAWLTGDMSEDFAYVE